MSTSNRVPTAQGKQRWKMVKIIPVKENREFGSFAKTQRILIAQVVNSLIIKILDIVIFAVKFM